MKLLLFLFLSSSLYAVKPELLLLNKYSEDVNVSSWYMSEKLDGVRAYWDGKRLISRNGKVFSVPPCFIKDFPSSELDGELWSKRGNFSNISSIVRKRQANESWKELTYNIFEVPNAEGNLLERLSTVKLSKYIKVIKQIKIEDKKHLNEFLKNVEEKGGEGVVVRDGSLTYYTGRNNNALKVKSYVDDECEVTGYTTGKGKYKGMTGALLCKMQNQNIIKIGSGLSDQEIINPPKISAIITFKYYGLTSKRNPRFPIFLRERK